METTSQWPPLRKYFMYIFQEMLPLDRSSADSAPGGVPLATGAPEGDFCSNCKLEGRLAFQSQNSISTLKKKSNFRVSML